MLKRIFDFFLSGIGLILLFPLFIIISFSIIISSRGPIFYKQKRVGLNDTDFFILKYRTMKIDSDKNGLLTVGDRDSRITSVGYYLRKLKLDELPQLINVFVGQMSLVGPRPEVRKYVELYSPADKIVLSVKPGITDYASIHFRNENEILKSAIDPEKKYVEEILPIKLDLNKKYILEKGLFTDVKIIFNTFKVILIN